MAGGVNPAPGTTGATVEARMGSSRLPGKVLVQVLPGWTLLDLVVARARRARRLDRVVVATSTNPGDDAIADHCRERGYDCHRGSESDVLARILGAARAFGFTRLVRLTGDNPLIDGRVIDALLDRLETENLDYLATTMMGHSENWPAERTFPRGVSMEALRLAALEAADRDATLPIARECPTFHIYDHPADFRIADMQAEGAFAAFRRPDLRLTVDTPQDLDLCRAVFARLGGGDPAAFGTDAAIALVAGDPALRALNVEVGHKIAGDIARAQAAEEGGR